MLAYVFWHWPQSSIDRHTYIDHLADFHRTLAANKPSGFHHSIVYRISGAAWLNTSGEAYEEWYVLDDSAAMDPLNEAAVSGACEQPHNRVAREAADGTGGLYRFRSGQEQLAQSRFAVWLSKPNGVSYSDFASLVGHPAVRDLIETEAKVVGVLRLVASPNGIALHHEKIGQGRDAQFTIQIVRL